MSFDQRRRPGDPNRRKHKAFTLICRLFPPSPPAVPPQMVQQCVCVSELHPVPPGSTCCPFGTGVRTGGAAGRRVRLQVQSSVLSAAPWRRRAPDVSPVLPDTSPLQIHVTSSQSKQEVRVGVPAGGTQVEHKPAALLSSHLQLQYQRPNPLLTFGSDLCRNQRIMGNDACFPRCEHPSDRIGRSCSCQSAGKIKLR